MISEGVYARYLHGAMGDQQLDEQALAGLQGRDRCVGRIGARGDAATGVSGATEVLAGWERGSFTAAGITHATYRRGTGPGVVVVHEIPGITPLVAKFADEVVDAGFTVIMPSLLGTPGKEPSGAYIARSALRLCVAREFTKLALGQTSPIISWLRALARNLHAEVGGAGRRRGRHVLLAAASRSG